MERSCKRIYRTTERHEHVLLTVEGPDGRVELRDQKGRAIGLLVTRTRETYSGPVRPEEKGTVGSWRIVPEGFELDVPYWGAYVQAARAGKAFGASQAAPIFRTEAEREEYIKARIEGARKRYSK